MSHFRHFRLSTITVGTALSVLAFSSQLSAQTVSGFTNTSGWSGLKVGSSYLTDLYNNPTGTDTTKQSGLTGSNGIWDMVGDASKPLFQIAEGTTSAGSAYAWSIRLADYNPSSLKTGSVGLLLTDSGGYYGYAMSFAANGTVSLYRIKPVEPINLSPSGFTFTYGNNSAANNNTAVSSGGILYNYESIGSGLSPNDAWLTFVVPLSEIRNFTGNAAWTYNNSVGATAFTTGQTINGSINADYAGTSTTSLTFSSESGTVAAIPEIPTAAFSAGLILPLAAFRAWRRRRVASGSQSA